MDNISEQSEIQFRPATENETEVRQRRRRSSASNRSGTRRNGGIVRIARDFWAE